MNVKANRFVAYASAILRRIAIS